MVGEGRHKARWEVLVHARELNINGEKIYPKDVTKLELKEPVTS